MPEPRKTPEDIAAIRKRLFGFYDTLDSESRKIGNAKFGVYAFYDHEGEPIYVGQTNERLRTRIGRHLTNHRTDAVAMGALDPLEVVEIEVWPLYIEGKSAAERKSILNATEFTVFQKLVETSAINATFNEKEITRAEPIDLPPSFRQGIVPHDVLERETHPDLRIARRALTLSKLARSIREREASPGLRKALMAQANRLVLSAKQRLESLGLEYTFIIEPGQSPLESEDSDEG